MAHYHVASGLTGYGPDAGNTTYRVATTAPELADEIRAELAEWADYERDGAVGYAGAEDYKAAWFMAQHVDEIEVMRANLDNERADAPLYQGDPDLWHETIYRLARESFPFDVDEGRSRVYAWGCEEPACEHLDTDDERPEVPDDFPVTVLGPDDPAQDRVTCGECGRAWDDAVPTSYTPTPAGRCPFEAFH